MDRSRRTHSTLQLPEEQQFFKTVIVALRTISLPLRNCGCKLCMCPNLYALFEASSLAFPTRNKCPSSRFVSSVSHYGHGYWVNMISSREAKNAGPACSYTSNLSEGTPDRAIHEEECWGPITVAKKTKV